MNDDDDEPGIPEITGVSEQLLYGCEHWIAHVSEVESPGGDLEGNIEEFLRLHDTGLMEIVASKSVFGGSMALWHWVEVSIYSESIG